MLDRVCIICGERHSIYLLTQNGVSLYQCLDCELIFRHPLSTENVITENEKKYSQSVERTVGAGKGLGAAQRYQQLLDNCRLNGGSIAVISSSKENNVVEAIRASGYQVQTFSEVESAWLCGSIENSFDAVILDHVIQRCAKPEEILRQAHRVLKNDGKIILGFSSIENQPQRWFGTQLAWNPANLYYFSHANMQLLLEKSGFCKIWNNSEAHSAREIFVAAKGEIRGKQSLSVVMPVYNEKPTFEAALNLVLQKELPGIREREIVVVDNNSTDGTRELVKSYSNHPSVKVVFADQAQGKGYAVREGIKHATGDIILIQDADLEYDIDDYDALLEPLLHYKKVFVLGSRHKGKWKMRSFLNNQLSAGILNSGQVFFTTLLNILYNQQMTDPLTMYKVFRRECLYGLKFECNGFDYDQELVSKLIRKGYTPHEVRVNYRSRSFSEGKKISMLRDPLLCLICDLKYRIASPFQEGWSEGPGTLEQSCK